MQRVSNVFKEKDFWLEENLRYSYPDFRLEKCARIVNALSRDKCCDLLDVGCGPATLEGLLQTNITYYGIDIAVHDSASNLLEFDFAQNAIGFGDKHFDIVVAAGVFEYLGGLQNKKFSEILSLLNKKGKFLVTYKNFHHINDRLIDHSVYNNIQPIEVFKESLESCFRVDKWFPSSHNWHCSEPRREFLKKIQLSLETTIPIISSMLAVNYFFICSLKDG